MIFTAAIYFCLIGEPHTFETCQLSPANVKYRTEQSCMLAVIDQVTSFYAGPLSKQYEIIDLKCHQYGSNLETL